VEDDVDDFAEAGEVLVDGVVQHFKNAVVEAAFIGIADIHAGSFADRFEAFEFVDLLGTVGLADGWHHIGVLFGERNVLVWHGKKAGSPAGVAEAGTRYKAEKRAKRNPLAGDSTAEAGVVMRAGNWRPAWN
jgi:hypothetical protein